MNSFVNSTRKLKTCERCECGFEFGAEIRVFNSGCRFRLFRALRSTRHTGAGAGIEQVERFLAVANGPADVRQQRGERTGV